MKSFSPNPLSHFINLKRNKHTDIALPTTAPFEGLRAYSKPFLYRLTITNLIEVADNAYPSAICYPLVKNIALHW